MPAEDKRAVGNRIRHARERAGYKRREDFAVRVGVHPGSVARWETGGSLPTPYYLDKIAEATGASVSWLRYGTGSGPEGRPAEQQRPEHRREPEAPEPEAEIVIGSFDDIARHLGGIAPPGQEKLRKLDALEAIADYYRAIGERLPHDWWELKRRVENDEL